MVIEPICQVIIRLKSILCRCLADEECLGYKYQHKGTGPGNSFLIHCTETDRQTFESDENGETYTKGNQTNTFIPILTG